MTHSSNRNVLILVGPTASGKTAVSLSLAKELDGEIVSADSRQLYKYLTIGTAKPTIEELSSVKHFFIDILTPDQDYNASEFSKQARVVIDDILDRGKTPIVVGGSGLYIQALVDGFFDGPAADGDVREKLEERLKTGGAEKLLEELRAVDPVSASKMLPSNWKRIIRALEVLQLTGVPISSLQQTNIPAEFTPCLVGLQWVRKTLYDRINLRVEKMLDAGLLDEVKSLEKLGYAKGLNALQTVGYREAFEFLEGKITFERMKELIKQNSRRYAKRQLTWFRADERIRWFDVASENDFSGVTERIKYHFKQMTL